jgi:uncharacterized membrane protein
MADKNVIVVSFSVEANAYQALSELKQVAAQGKVGLDNAVVIERAADGSFSVKDMENQTIGNKTGIGGLIGAFVGILGGPLGVLFGWGAGSLIGSASEVDDAIESQAILAKLSTLIPAGSSGLIAEVDEVANEVVDGVMSKLDGTVTRQSSADVEAEVAAAAEAQAAAQREASRVLREKNRAERKERVEGWLDDVKDRITGKSND